MTIFRTTVVALTALVAAFLPGLPMSAATNTALVEFASTGACGLSSGTLVSIKAPVVKARMESGWASRYTSQPVRVVARLQGLRSGTWTDMTNAGATTTATTKVGRAYVSTFRTLTAPADVKVPATGPDNYRLLLTVEWLSPSTGKVVRTVKHGVGSYTFNGATAPRCQAALPPAGLTALSFVATGVDNQGRAVLWAAPAAKARVLQCRPHCGSASTTLPAGVAMSGRQSTVTSPAYLFNGQVSTFSARTCLAAHRTICSGFKADSTTPFGPLPAPTITVTGSGQCLNWAVTGSGNGKTVDASVVMDGNALVAWSSAGSIARSGQTCVGYGTSRTLTLKLQDSPATPEQNVVRGTVSAEASGTTGTAPRTMLVDFVETTAVSPDQCFRPCYFVRVTVDNFTPGSYPLTGQAMGPGVCSGPFSSTTITADSTGHGSRQPGWWISSTCDAVTVTVDGISKTRAVP